jgi:hypothetical protein
MSQNQHTITVPKGSAYILEGCMQNSGPCTTPNKILLWGRIWDKVRKAVDRGIAVPWQKELLDFETPVLRGDDESELAFKRREVAFNAAFDAWKEQPCTLVFTDKYRDAIREALKYVIAHKDDERAQTRVATSLHWGKLLIAFGLATDSDADDEPAPDKE